MAETVEPLDYLEPALAVPYPAHARTGSRSTDRRPSFSAFSQTARVTAHDLPVLGNGTDIELTSVNSKAPIEDAVSETPAESIHAPEPISPSQKRLFLYVLACCWSVVVMGWNDGSTGPLILRMEAFWNVGFAVVSLLYVCSFVGFIVAGLLNVWLSDKLGFGKIVVVGSSCQLIAAVLESTGPPFPVFALAFAFNGFGGALLNAHLNTLIASMPDPAPKLGILHMSYGFGAFLSPFAATQFAQMPRWSIGYIVQTGFALTGVIIYVVTFRFRTEAQILGAWLDSDGPIEPVRGNKMKQIFQLSTVHVLAFFVLVYVGLEVTLGGWIVTYLVQVRGGGPSSGYASSGFFGGLALGRVLLLWVNKKLGTNRVIYLYSFLVLGLLMIVWFVPSVIGDAVAAALIGLLLGPFYPLMIGVSRQILPRGLLTGAIGWIGSFGQAGSALFPFITGALAQKYGIKILQPMLVAMMAVDICLWAALPYTTRLMT
ncbi:MFS general substrate transporter [Dacryopinax primogenitus]|uniref:MFS general substrate transporter n=1 Tax=Dacryopinax primogenitus (strain DJM 731) TaxID=1858805 RepID=M5GB26_DACPD|nr:MFS general substrate transporter [Dacryopinax primogenitus]EJU06129.1 MFS general substrate transporter [Dacryopinax primogenitus]